MNPSPTAERCETCKFWDSAPNDLRISNFKTRSEGAVKVVTEKPDAEWETRIVAGWGECTAILQKEDAQPTALAVLSDASGYFAALATRAEFGCVLWQGEDGA